MEGRGPGSTTATSQPRSCLVRPRGVCSPNGYAPSAPEWLRQLPVVDVLRRVWIQQFSRDVDTETGRAEVRRREAAPDGEGLPPGHLKIISPCDLDARYSIKRDTGWGGYKVHFTETCDTPAPPATDSDGGAGRRPRRDEVPNLITNVATTAATVPDVAMTTSIHQQLADKGLAQELAHRLGQDGEGQDGGGRWAHGCGYTVHASAFSLWAAESTCLYADCTPTRTTRSRREWPGDRREVLSGT
jgi:hypothetical protein